MMKRFTLLTFLVAQFISIDLFSQARIENKLTFYDAESWILFEDYKEALPEYLQLLKSYPNNSNLKYRIGQCYINTPGEKEKAIGYLEESVKNINPKYREGRFRETGAPYEALYHLANAYRINDQLDKAIETYMLFRKNMNTRIYDSVIVNQQIQSCLTAKELMAKPFFVREKNIGNSINDKNSEYNPVISDDEKIMIFTKGEAFYDAILYSVKTNGAWSSPINMNELLKVDRDIYPTSLSKDSKTLYLYNSADYDGNIFSTVFANGGWSPISKLNDNINTKYWESHATISHDNKKLYFTSNRKGTLGGLDIYVSKIDSSGNWGPPDNLGPVINTPYNEDTPFLSEDDKTLFFSSRGHYNMGGYDIFYSTLLDNGEWSVPLNAGYPLNSTDDDQFFKPVKDGYEGYFAKYNPNGFGKQDIYRIEVFSENHPRKFYVMGLARGADLLSSVKVSAMNTINPSQTMVVYSNPKTGQFELQTQQGNFDITYEADGSEKLKTNFTFPLLNPSDTFILPEVLLAKTDFIADLLVKREGALTVNKDEPVLFPLKVEPNSTLTVEHWVGDKLVSTENYVTTDSTFNYKMVPQTGDNRVTFKLTDRYGNAATSEVLITRKKPVIERKDVRVIYRKIPADKQAAALAEIEKRRADSIMALADPSIAVLKEKILAYSEISESGERLRQSVNATEDKKILKAGSWLQSIYNESITRGLTDMQMADMFGVIGSLPGTKADSFLQNFADAAEEPLLSWLNSINLKKEKITTPSDLILYILRNKAKKNIPDEVVFNSLANLIKSQNIPVDTIKSRTTASEKNNLRYLWWLLIAAGFIFFFIIIFRRLKGKNNKEE